MASGPWSVEETNVLLDVWDADSVQSQLDGITRSKTVYQRVASRLSDLGYKRTWQQRKTKVKNLVQRYRKVRKSCSGEYKVDRFCLVDVLSG